MICACMNRIKSFCLAIAAMTIYNLNGSICMASFTAGHFYDISGRMDGISGERHHAMYVADEGNMHVFASATDKGILMRVKVHEGDINSVNGPDIEVNSGQTRIIVFPRPERAESVNRFVDRA